MSADRFDHFDLTLTVTCVTLTGAKVTKACDTYSFGILMYELYTSERPYADVLKTTSDKVRLVTFQGAPWSRGTAVAVVAVRPLGCQSAMPLCSQHGMTAKSVAVAQASRYYCAIRCYTVVCCLSCGCL